MLGLPVSNRAGDEWAEFQAGPVRLALHRTEDSSVPPSGTVVFRVADLDEARWSLEQRGVVFDGHESEVPGVARFATFHDPDGNPIQLIEYLARPDTPDRDPGSGSAIGAEDGCKGTGGLAVCSGRSVTFPRAGGAHP